MRTSSRFGMVCGLWLALGLATAWAGEGLERRVDEVLHTKPYGEGHWGLLVVDAANGRTIYELNADQLFCPASVTKLFTTSAALADLGADYRFQTPLLRRGEVDSKGVLQGDLILVAQGDLSFGGRTGPDGTLLFRDHDHTYAGGNLQGELVEADPLAGLDHLARAAAGAGIKRVEGDVLVDDRLFEPARSSGSGPKRVSCILVNDNVVDVVVTPGAKPGEPASVKLVPPTAFVTADAQVETIAEDGRPSLRVRSEGPRSFSVRGRLPVGHRSVVKVFEVEEPASFARALLIEALRRRGVEVSASPLSSNAAAKLPSSDDIKRLPKVAEYTSPPFRENLRVILKVSHNLHASTLPLLLAAHHGERTLEDGLRREGQFLESVGIDPGSISFGGGAGGERANLTSARATVALLRAMAKRSDFAAYEAALPVLGRDGTLARAVDPESPARGHVRAKTGTYFLDNELTGKALLTSKALAGFIDSASGQTFVFAFFVNNVPINAGTAQADAKIQDAGRLLGKLAELFYSYDPTDPARKPQPAAEKSTGR